MIKDHHELVRSGPYHLVRHPIYAGAILACFGTALVVGELGAFAGAALTTVAWAIKMRTEEALLTSEFGEAYVEYKRQVKAIIPFVI